MKLLIPFALTFGVLIAAAYWDEASSEADLVIVNRGEVFTLDPQRMSYVQDFRLAYAIYEGLLRWNNRDLSIEPAAADLPHVSDDGLTYTFALRPAAKWSNGDAVTAHDFVYSWQRLLWPDTAADYSNLFFVIDGAEDFFRWRSRQLTSSGTMGVGRPLTALDEAQARLDETVGIRALDDRTLQVRLRQPCAYFLDLVCFAVAYPVHRPTVEGWPKGAELIDAERGWAGVEAPGWDRREYIAVNAASGRIEQRHEWARPGRLVSNGPYVLAEWRYKRDMRLERNPQFHRPQLLRNGSVALVSIEDANTTVLAFEAGKVHWLADVNAEYVADMLDERRRYEERHRTELAALSLKGKSLDDALALLPAPDAGERRNIHARPTFGTDFFSFNCRPQLADGSANPFADARVRRAFAVSVNKSAIVQTATRLGEPIATTLIPRGSIPEYESPAGLPLDLDRARHELAEAGWIDRDHDGLIENDRGGPFPIIDLLYTTNSPRYKWMALELKAQWERELGVRVELRGADTKFYKEDLKLGKFMIARGRWYGDYGDPTTFLDINKTGDGNNDRGFSSPGFDALLGQAAAERDASKRLRLLERAERLLMEEELPLIPICQLVQVYMYEPGELRGLTDHPRLIQYLWQMEAAR